MTALTSEIRIIPVLGIPLIKEKDNLSRIISERIKLEEGDIVVICETVVSKAQGRVVNLKDVIPSNNAIELSKKTGKDPRLVQLILDESKDVLKVGDTVIVVETKDGNICASAGIDVSNVCGNESVVGLLPLDPDLEASSIRNSLKELTGVDVAVIISDTQGRPFRSGAIGVAIGVSGMRPLWKRAGEKDLYGYELKSSVIATADEAASAASLLMGQADEGIPVVIIRGARYLKGEGSSKELLREKEKDLFRSK
ncbi:MAG: Coenzyme F420:L-glutamate ligase [Candidatus Methanofastidiosum methylothiophilum]|uniref:Coenzyme F420:L-glutamate ligase n=1 Tax=Candidatus Methanofastidiosum methylothiophilum TaxID=1705564 RepID=A0A150J605_9EURY|nr:MAG: Coenzyme F420:L-glutamate ligase [Candidatus Methanofastidiosum methylthiophilus]